MPQPAGDQFLNALQRHALRLLGTWFAWAREAEWIGRAGQDGLSIAVEEVTRILEQLEPETPQVPDSAPVDALSCYLALREELTQLEVEGDVSAVRWRRVIARVAASEVEEQLLALLVTIGADQGLCRAYRYAWADFGRVSMPLGFAARVLGGDADPEQAGLARARVLLTEQSTLFGHYLVSRHRETQDTPLSEVTIVAHDETIATLVGAPRGPMVLRPIDAIGAPPQRLAVTLERVLARARTLEAGLPRRWSLHGPEGSGAHEVAAHVLAQCYGETGLWACNVGRAVEAGTALASVKAAVRGAVLHGAAIILEGVDRLAKEVCRRWVEAVEEILASAAVVAFWVLEEPLAFMDVTPEAMIPLGYPSRAERLEVWTQNMGDVLDAGDLARMAGRFLITEGQIVRTAIEARAHAVLSAKEGTEGLLVELDLVARREAAVGLGRLATPESKRVGLDMLIVDKETRILLHEVISYTQHRDRLATEWGFEQMMPYGLGVTALFAGPPGTGKTLAANAIATALGLELYRVDLSQLVSKYIGETEKHLSTLFTAAESGEVMLLFDEADSLFSKRTEVKSSVDRYANLEVNYLLQRIERFDGVVILTTNFEAGIDDAFARRIRFRVAFPEPDARARLRLWRALTPADVPLADDVDFEQLSEEYELSGGHIKEVVLRAAALAMSGEYGAKVTHELLVRSAEAEYRKLGKLVITYDD